MSVPVLVWSELVQLPLVPGVFGGHEKPGAPFTTMNLPSFGKIAANAASSFVFHTFGGFSMPPVRSKTPPLPLWFAAAAVEPSLPMEWHTVQLARSTSGVGELPLMRSIAPFCCASGELYVL